MDDKSQAIDVSDKQSTISLRQLHLDTTEIEWALKRLDGLSDRRPDLWRQFCLLEREGSLFLCRLDREAAAKTGRCVLQLRPTGQLNQLVDAYYWGPWQGTRAERTVSRPVGKNTFGASENAVMDILISLWVPGQIYRYLETHEPPGSDGS